MNFLYIFLSFLKKNYSKTCQPLFFYLLFPKYKIFFNELNTSNEQIHFFFSNYKIFSVKMSQKKNEKKYPDHFLFHYYCDNLLFKYEENKEKDGCGVTKLIFLSFPFKQLIFLI